MNHTAVILFALLSLAGSLRADHHEQGFFSLFDGKSLDQWDGKAGFWSVEDGAITGKTTKDNPTNGNTFLIWRGGTVDDFELRLQFKIVGGNSGIQYRSEDLGNHVVGGYQGDFEAGETFSGILYEEKGRGILAQRGQLTRVVPVQGGKHEVHVVASLGDTRDINRVIKKEDWNDYQILATGNRLTHIINGRVTVQVVDLDAKRAAKSGVLALQLHAGDPMRVQFKNIRLKPTHGLRVTGDWEFEVDINGNTGNPAFSFRQDNGKLSGVYEGLLGRAMITGEQEGHTVSWRFEASYDGNPVECVYEGKLVGADRMEGTVTANDGVAEGTWTAKRKSP